MSATRKPFGMTITEFLDWCPDDGNRWQLVDGEPMAMAPPQPRHGIVQSEAVRLIGNHLERVGSPCVVATTPGIVPALRASMNFRVPDFAVTCAMPTETDRHLREPILVVEVLSPTNRRETWANVWAYTTIPGVREIVVLHTQAPRAELLRREADGNWPPEPLVVTEGDIELASIGFRAPLIALYRTAGLTG